MITKLLLKGHRSITIYTSSKGGGGLRLETTHTSAWFTLSAKEQARLSYALADHRLRKSDEIKELV